VTQALVRTPDLRARRAVCEIMVMNRAIGKLIMTTRRTCSLAAADRQGRRHADDGPGAARRDRGEGGRSEDAFTYASDKRPFARFVPDATAILRADVTQGLES